MTPAGVGLASVLAVFAAEGGGEAASVKTIVGILLYAGIAYATVRTAVRWAQAALSPSAGGEPVDGAQGLRPRGGSGRPGG